MLPRCYPLITERIFIMGNRHYYTEEEMTVIRCNPFTSRVSSRGVVFTLAFKEFVMENIDKPKMTCRKLFKLAGYPDGIFSLTAMNRMVQRIRREAMSPQGLQEPPALKGTAPRKKQTHTEVKELKERITILEQQVNFLKKSQWLKQQNASNPPNSLS